MELLTVCLLGGIDTGWVGAEDIKMRQWFYRRVEQTRGGLVDLVMSVRLLERVCLFLLFFSGTRVHVNTCIKSFK